jgi:NitT/TauT family transport system substrate-binding protein
MSSALNRRHFLAGLPAMTAGLIASPAYAEPPPETATVRLPVFANVSDCQTPLYIAEALLHGEGITDVRFIGEGTGPDSSDWIQHGEIDFDFNFPPAYIRSIANGAAITVVAGMHVGCLELIANESVRSVAELKRKKVGISEANSIPHLLLMIIAANVGLDPAKDIEWVTSPSSLDLLADGKIDAFLATPPEPQIARDRKIGHVILDTAVDRPWSQYYCCMLGGTADYVANYPVATKRVLRALLKSVDFCVADPESAARRVVDLGYAANYDYALQAMREVRYDKWRDYDPEDSIRFYALRMQETGIIQGNPNDIIAKGTDWRFVNELKRELKT